MSDVRTFIQNFNFFLKDVSASSQRDGNILKLTNLKREDAGIYDCTNAFAECYKFNLVLEDEREVVELYAEIDAAAELTCGEESTQYDSFIRWRKLNGVGFYNKKIQMLIFQKIFNQYFIFSFML